MKNKFIKIEDKGKFNGIRKYIVILSNENDEITSVNRRFKHFYLLSQKIQSIFEYAIIPTIPEKQFWKKKILGEDEKKVFYEIRKELLEFYLNHLFNHFIIQETDLFKFFFSESENFDNQAEEFYKITQNESFREYETENAKITNKFLGYFKRNISKKISRNEIELYDNILSKYQKEKKFYSDLKENLEFILNKTEVFIKNLEQQKKNINSINNIQCESNIDETSLSQKSKINEINSRYSKFQQNSLKMRNKTSFVVKLSNHLHLLDGLIQTVEKIKIFFEFYIKFKSNLDKYMSNDKILKEFENCESLKNQYVKVFEKDLKLFEDSHNDFFNNIILSFNKLF